MAVISQNAAGEVVQPKQDRKPAQSTTKSTEKKD